MWLLNITFEDFVCINYPERSVDLVASALQIDTFLNHPLKPNSKGYKADFRFEPQQSIITDKRSPACADYYRSKDKSIDKNITIDGCCISNSIEQICRIGTENKKIRKTLNENCNHRSSILVSRRSGSMAEVHRDGVTIPGGWNQCDDCRGHIVGNNRYAYFSTGLHCQEHTAEDKPSNFQGITAYPDEQTRSCSESPVKLSAGEDQSTARGHSSNDTQCVNCETNNLSYCSGHLTQRKNEAVGRRSGLTRSFLLSTYALSGKTSPRRPIFNNNGIRNSAQRDNTTPSEQPVGNTTPSRKSGKIRSMSADNASSDIFKNPTRGESITRPSPATVSSGYESDFMPVCEADIDNILCNLNGNLKGGSILNSHKQPCAYEGNVLNSNEQYANVCRNKTDIGNCNVKKYPQTEGKKKNPTEINGVKVRKQNSKLTKLTRSMYEIIHDLQAADNSVIDNHRTGHKNRRQFPLKCMDMITDLSADNIHTGKDSIGSLTLKEQAGNNAECVLVRVGDVMVNTSNSDQCSSRNRTFSISGEDTSTLTDCFENRACQGCVNCEMNGQSANTFTGVFRANVCFTNVDRNSSTINSSKSAGTDKSISVRERWWQKRCDRYISNVSYVSNVPWRDDGEHIYETIPWDEPQYAVINKNNVGSDPIKKFQRVPEMPGTFVPSDPPKLPARKQKCYVDNLRSTDNYMEMSDTLYSTVKKTKTATGIDFSVCSQLTSCSESQPQSDYCHFDPLRSVHDFSENDLNRWSTSDLLNHIDGIQQPPAKRRENLYWLLDDGHIRAQFSESLEIENKLKDMGVFDSCYSSLMGFQSSNWTANDPVTRSRDTLGNCYMYSAHQSDLLNMSPSNRPGDGNDVGLEYIQPTYV